MVSDMDEETEKRGSIAVMFKISPPQFPASASITSFIDASRASTDLPITALAYHKMMEVNTPGISRVARLVDMAVGLLTPETRARMRIYYGTLV